MRGFERVLLSTTALVLALGTSAAFSGDATGEAPATSWTSLCRTRTAVVVSAAISSRAAQSAQPMAVTLARSWHPGGAHSGEIRF